MPRRRSDLRNPCELTPRILANAESSASNRSHAAQTAWSRGIEIEKKAEAFFSEVPGMRLLCRNYGAYSRKKKGEIDLVYFDSARELVFVEVRSRVSGESWERAEESLDWDKLRHLRWAMEIFLVKKAHELPPKIRAIRLDLLSWNGESWTWIKDVRV